MAIIRSSTIEIKETEGRRISRIALRNDDGIEAEIRVSEEPGARLVLQEEIRINESRVSVIQLSLGTVTFHFSDFDDMVVTQKVVNYESGILTMDFPVPFEVAD